MIKISWIQDLNIFGNFGGAELSDKEVFKEGVKRGYDMQLVTPETAKLEEIVDVDLVIISNASRYSPDFLSKIVETCEYMIYQHDFVFLCKWRLFYPDLDKCKKTCPVLPFTRKMMLNSSLNIFLSPLHHKIWKRVLPELKDVPHHLHVSSVDTAVFKPLDVPKVPNSVVCINCLLKFKDLDNILEYAQKNPDKRITCMGGIEGGVKLPPNIFYKGGIPNTQLPQIYAQTEAFFHRPQTTEPCGRTCIEAKLCGVPNLILNKLVGVASYPQFKYDRDEFAKWIEGSPKRFWAKIEKEVL